MILAKAAEFARPIEQPTFPFGLFFNSDRGIRQPINFLCCHLRCFGCSFLTCSLDTR